MTMFILEYKENNGNWKVQYISNINYYVLHGVDFTKDYYFRISALNSVGKGETSKVFHVVFGGKTVICCFYYCLLRSLFITLPRNNR